MRKAIQAFDPGWVTPEPDIPGAQLHHVCLVRKQQALAPLTGSGYLARVNGDLCLRSR